MSTTAEFKIEYSDRLNALPPYLFVEIDKARRAAIAAGRDIINLGVGDPDQRTHQVIIDTMKKAVEDLNNHHYPFDAGVPQLRVEIAKWFKNRFGVELEPQTEIYPLIGSKEGIAHLPLGIINPGIRPAKADVYLPYAEAEALAAAHAPHVPFSGQANLILVEVTNSAVQDQAIREVKSLYPDLVISSYACHRPAAKARAINTTAITLLMAAIGVFTVLLAMASQLAVLVERRRELGILKTLGFANGRIMGQIVLESLAQATLGALLASLLVLPLMPWVRSRWLAPMEVPVFPIPWLVIGVLALGLAILGGLLAGLFPALWAVRQRPSSLLRSF